MADRWTTPRLFPRDMAGEGDRRTRHIWATAKVLSGEYRRVWPCEDCHADEERDNRLCDHVEGVGQLN